MTSGSKSSVRAVAPTDYQNNIKAELVMDLPNKLNNSAATQALGGRQRDETSIA